MEDEENINEYDQDNNDYEDDGYTDYGDYNQIVEVLNDIPHG